MSGNSGRYGTVGHGFLSWSAPTPDVPADADTATTDDDPTETAL